MRNGNVEFATWNLGMHQLFIPYFIGKPLETILSNCGTLVSVCHELKQVNQALYGQIFWQVVLNLTGKSAETIVLKGEAFDDCEESILHAPNQEEGTKHQAFINFMKSELFVIFGDFEAAADLAVARGDELDKALSGSLYIMFDSFFRGVALYAMARRTKKRVYKRCANQMRKKIEKWVKLGNPNVQHFHCLLNAEHAALNKQYAAAEGFYGQAIKLAARTGFLHHAALFNERYADFLRHERGDAYEATFRIEEALRYYKTWGASAKAEILAKSLE